MSRLYEVCKQVSESLESTHAGEPLELIRAKGLLATKVGFLVSLVTPHDYDDPMKIAAVLGAAAELGIELR